MLTVECYRHADGFAYLIDRKDLEERSVVPESPNQVV